MTIQKFKTKINEKIHFLQEENKKAINIGDKHTYHTNCNMLKGIEFVMEKLNKYVKLKDK